MAPNYQKQSRKFSAAKGARSLRGARRSLGPPLFNLNAGLAAMGLLEVPPPQPNVGPPNQKLIYRNAKRRDALKRVEGKRAGKRATKRLAGNRLVGKICHKIVF
jgi:hypothetical protein